MTFCLKLRVFFRCFAAEWVAFLKSIELDYEFPVEVSDVPGPAWGQNSKTERKGSVPGLPCQMTMVGGCGLLKRQGVHKRERGKEVGGQKPETKPVWLSFGSAVLNSSGERQWMLVGLLVKSDGGCRAVRLQTRAGERGWELKT